MTSPHDWRGRRTFGSGRVVDTAEVAQRRGAKRVLIISGGGSFTASGASRMLDKLTGTSVVELWSDFQPNASIDELRAGLAVVREFEPDMVIGVGGGSVMDMAKLLVAYSDRDDDPTAMIRAGAPVERVSHDLVLVPTTSGSGSESTHFAVVYIGDEKFSVAGPGLYASHIIIDPDLSMSGSSQQRATSGIDAICQAIESLWAAGATSESRRLARTALRRLIPNIRPFVTNGDSDSARAMAIGAHLSGRAIDISKTTGAHALSYFLTKRLGIPHGNAVALTLGAFIEAHQSSVSVTNSSGSSLGEAMKSISVSLGAYDSASLRRQFNALLPELGLIASLNAVVSHTEDFVDEWLESVNQQRLANNPIPFDRSQLRALVKLSWGEPDCG